MPLVRIDLIEGRSVQQLKTLCDTLHGCVVKAFAVPQRDRFQIISEHKPHQMIIQDVGLGMVRTSDVIVIQITTTPRSLSSRKVFFRLLAESLQEACEISPDDLVVNFVVASESDWSFGQGKAQFLTGEL